MRAISFSVNDLIDETPTDISLSQQVSMRIFILDQ